MTMIEKLEKLARDADVMHATLSRFDDLNAILSALGHTLDYWAFEHGVSAEDLEDGLVRLAEASKLAHNALGMPTEAYQEGVCPCEM